MLYLLRYDIIKETYHICIYSLHYDIIKKTIGTHMTLLTMIIYKDSC